KRKPDDLESEGSVKDGKINYVFTNDISIVDKASIALQRDCSNINLCIDSTTGSSPWLKPTVINTTFGPLILSDDPFFLNKNKKLILVTRYLCSVEKVTKFVTSASNARVRIIDTNIVTNGSILVPLVGLRDITFAAR
ncbi:hypothetical protein AVEN_90959-1, partial [Araneus ventricosus]